MAAQKQFTTSAGSHLNNREIFYGPATPGSTPYTWPVPSGTTEVHVHVWGGGGPGHYLSWAGAGGGGGGYARAPYTVTDSDTLAITVGGAAATSSVTIPTQSPTGSTSPVSATGGSIGNAPSNGGVGGSGAVTLNPTFPHYYCMTANGGCGGWGTGFPVTQGAGGAAGSPLGTGGDGGWGCSTFGGGIGQAPGNNRHKQEYHYCVGGTGPYTTVGTIYACHGGNYLTGRKSGCYYNPDNYSNYTPSSGSTGDYSTIVLGSVGCSNFMETIKTCWHCWNPASYILSTCPGGFTRTYSAPEANTSRGSEWFYVEDMAGAGGYQYTTPTSDIIQSDAGAGAGGGPQGQAGILGGGSQCNNVNWALPTSAGYGGGGGSNNSAPAPQGPHTGGAGLVILYW